MHDLNGGDLSIASDQGELPPLWGSRSGAFRGVVCEQLAGVCP